MSGAGYPAGAMFDPAAPFNQPSLDIADVRKIDRRADELAIEGFDTGDKFVSNFLRDECEDDVRSVVMSAIAWARTDSEDVDTRLYLVNAIERLRERYVRTEAALYRDAAEEEVLS